LVQRCLALVIGCPLETIRLAVAPTAERHERARLRFNDLPYARPFDLQEEALPPGIPEVVLAPSGWGRLWWLAPSGSGRSLVGQWLAARGLARFLSTVCWSGVLERLPGARPLFLELERADDLGGLIEALPDAPVCVAAPLPPPDHGTVASPWTLVTSPALDTVLPALLAWIAARVPRDGSFEAGAAEAWLRRPIATGELPTLGAVLGAAGLLDTRGVRGARGKSLAELAEGFVNERLAQATTAGSAEAQWLKRFGFDALIQLAQSALTSSEIAWTLARSEDEWIALVPGELGMKAGVGRTRIASPRAFRIVRALVDADLLAERAPGRLVIAPDFLRHAALARAREALVDAPALDWGEALLRPHAAAGVLEALYRKFEAEDFGAIEQLAEVDASAHPALVVASEACLVCCGLRALCGAEVPSEQLEALWNEQLAQLIELPGELPQPRLLCSTAPDTSPLARHAVWMLGLLAASELLGERQGRTHPLLRPWGARPTSERLRPMLDAIYAALADVDVAEREWAVEGFALAGRLLEPDDADSESTLPDDARSAAPHALARPAQLAQALLDGGLDGGWLRGFGEHPLELRALQAACDHRHIAWSRMAHAIWKTWQSRGCPADQDRLLSPGAVAAPAFWPHLPPEVLGTAWVRWISASTWPFTSFAAGQWSAFANYFGDRWRRAPASGVWRAAFEHMDLANVERALERGRLLHAPEPEVRPLLASIWRRFPAWLVCKLGERAASGDEAAVTHLLETAPAAADDEIVRTLAEELCRRSTQKPVIDSARSFLFAKVAARRGDWRSAYALLVDLEARLARAERARGSSARELER
jgi:hypothetical protein